MGDEINQEIMDEVLEEIKDISDSVAQIDMISKLMCKNLIAIYDAVTEISLSDKESFNTVRKLAMKQKCYENERKKLSINGTMDLSGKSKR